MTSKLARLLVVLIVVLAASHTPPQAIPAADVVVLEVTTPSQRVSTIAVPVGGRATVGQEHGRMLSLEPTRGADGRLDIAVSVRVSDPETGAESWVVAGRLLLDLGEPARFEDPVFPIGVAWKATRSPLLSATTGATPCRADGEPCQRCCVVCGGEVICACRVQAPCGECCCPSACPCDITG